MKLVILAGGLGSRLSEETDNKPKPMIEIGGKPILWHIMKIYSYYGINDFIICCGYKGFVIKEYFKNYFLHTSNVKISLENNTINFENKKVEPWTIRLVDTGEKTMTGGRLKQISKYIKNEDLFCMTYGDGVADINIKKLLIFHKKHKGLATLLAARPQARFGALKIDKKNSVTNFEEKPEGDGGWINGGFFILHPSTLDRIKDNNTIWEQEPLNWLAKEKQLYAYKHKGFFMPMDTLRDKVVLNNLWNDGKAKWKVW
jgi:glucose-1-phosphate cytidylyltransferase